MNNKKSPANAKENARQWNSGTCLKARCEQNLSSPIPAMMFHLHSPAEGRQRAQPVSLSRVGLKSQIFPTSLSFSALA